MKRTSPVVLIDAGNLSGVPGGNPSPGKDFLRNSSDNWARASIVAGTPRDRAVAAAERTRAFHTGEAPVSG